MKDVKVTVIIPVYRVESYLRRCVDSVINQTYRNLEIILVDDGSPDGCPQICDEYLKKDSRVKVIHKKNGGLSSARNVALDSPLTGDYVTFVDSDDWISPDYYEYCVRLLEEKKADVIQIDYSLVSDTKIDKKEPKVERIETHEGKDILQYFMTITTSTTGSYCVWRCLYALSLIGSDRFREGKINEDIDWKYKIFRKSKRLVVSNRVMYYYYQSSESISKGGLKQRDFQLREAADLLAKLTAEEKYGTIAYLGQVKKARTAFSLLSKIAYFGVEDPAIDKKETVRILTNEHRRNVQTLLRAPLPFSRKILVVMFAINYNLAATFVHFAKQITK